MLDSANLCHRHELFWLHFYFCVQPNVERIENFHSTLQGYAKIFIPLIA